MGYQTHRLTGNDGERPLMRPGAFREAVAALVEREAPRLRRLWAYYRNELRACAPASGLASASDRPYRQAQEWGLPGRITGLAAGSTRKEVVIENDIAWRIDAMVEYLFGRPLVIRSAAPDPARRAVLDRLVRAILARNGGVLFLQQMALLGAVYGFVDVLVKLVGEAGGPAASSAPASSSVMEGHPATTDLGEPPRGACADDDGDGAGKEEGESGQGAGTREAPGGPATGGDGRRGDDAGDVAGVDVDRLARRIRLEIVEPTRALPLLSAEDWRVVEGYAQVWEGPAPRAPLARRGSGGTSEGEGGEGGASGSRGPGRAGWWGRLLRSAGGWLQGFGDDNGRAAIEGGPALNVELITAGRWQRYADEALVAEGVNSLGAVPLVHVQNTALPFQYAGASDVEPLIPIQDELNTRLSDRANRVALQSFKMYLGKGIENFTELPVGPGRLWATDNEAAEVVEFGGEADCPAETAHIADLREAMDKTSGVSPIAAGAIKDRIGRLTSAAALRVTLMALLARTEKKRTTYGAGIARMVELALAWLDRAGLFATEPAERAVELHWPSPLPENDLEKLAEAEAKARLGVPREVVLRELGY